MSPEERAVVNAAYAWRYAMVTPDADVTAAQDALIEAVDDWDIERAYTEDSKRPGPRCPARSRTGAMQCELEEGHPYGVVAGFHSGHAADGSRRSWR